MAQFGLCDLPNLITTPAALKAGATSPLMERRYRPNCFHNASILFFTSGSILISSGQGRVKPSEGHLHVASTPIFEPKLGKPVAQDPLGRPLVA